MQDEEITKLETEIRDRMILLNELRANQSGTVVSNYDFETLDGKTTLLDLFGERRQLLMIHNMGEGCRYCTLWADGFNGLLDHLESAFAVVLTSKEPVDTQRRFANSRGWRFRLASHGSGDYMTEQTVLQDNMPGAVVYEREGDTIYRKNNCVFGPGDIYCAMWSLLGLAGKTEDDWTPQYRYWQMPEQLDDGGRDILI
jgi:predicted dithiol-disulfide oxidoreductase (DUF899 family)